MLLGLSGCSGGDDPIEEEEEEEDDDDDGEDQVPAPSYFEPTGLYVSWEIGMLDGAINPNTAGGNYFFLTFASDAWDGANDEKCEVVYDLNVVNTVPNVYASGDTKTDTSTETSTETATDTSTDTDTTVPGDDSAFADAGAIYGGWKIPAGSPYTLVGKCDQMDPLGTWTTQIPTVAETLDWGYGFGPPEDADIASMVSTNYPDFVDSYFDGYVLHDITVDGLSIEPMLYNFLVGMNKDGTIAKGTTVSADGVSGPADLPDAFYYGVTYWYWGLK